MLCTQISQVCQLCQQSPRLFTNHAAQLHTLLVSVFTLGISGNTLELLALFSLVVSSSVATGGWRCSV